MLGKLFGTPKNSPFNQATEYFQNLRYYESGSPQYVSTILEIIRLCQMAIQGNKNDGDAHVLLANVYVLAALDCTYTKGYPYFLARSAAVMQATRSRKMYIKNREIADKIHAGIVEQLATQMPDWVEGVERLPTDLNLLNQLFYDAAIVSSSLDELRAVLNGGQQIHEPGAVGSQIRDSTHANVAQGNQPIKVLIVDDVEVAREAYRRLLRDSSEIRIVGEATNGLEAIEQFDKLMPDVAIMDINMPVLDGLSATEEICKRHPKAKIIICSVQSDPMYKRRASLSGAKEYIEIPPLQTELVDAIRRVVGRGTP